jgi:hypothetical protein
MISEHDMVVLTADIAVPTASLPHPQLQAGDVGTVVHVYRQGEAYEVEFSTMQGGAPFALVTLPANQVRPLGSRDLFHVRELAA